MGDALKLRALAASLNAHLKRLEASRVCDWMNAGCYYMGGARLRITYRSREGGLTLTRAQAIAYLAQLDGGFVGRHTELMPPSTVSTKVLDGPR